MAKTYYIDELIIISDLSKKNYCKTTSAYYIEELIIIEDL